MKESLDFEVADKLLDGHFSLESFEDIGPLETLDWIVRRALRVSSTSLILRMMVLTQFEQDLYENASWYLKKVVEIKGLESQA